MAMNDRLLCRPFWTKRRLRILRKQASLISGKTIPHRWPDLLIIGKSIGYYRLARNAQQVYSMWMDFEQDPGVDLNDLRHNEVMQKPHRNKQEFQQS